MYWARPCMVVENGKNFFVVVFSGNAIGNFIKIDPLIQEDQQSAVASFGYKHREQFEEVIPILIMMGAYYILNFLKFSH